MAPGRSWLAGFAGSIWTVLLRFAVLPLYLHYLGLSAYGLVGFLATTQAVFQFLDLGFAFALNRDVARCAALGDVGEARGLLRTLTVVYGVTAVLIAVTVIALAPWIGDHWLQSSVLPRDTVARAVMLIGIVIGCRWPQGLYGGALLGAQRLTWYSLTTVVMETLTAGASVALLGWFSGTIEGFLVVQASVALLQTIVLRYGAWSALGTEAAPHPSRDFRHLIRIWRFSAGNTAIALSALVFTQLDKVILSRTLDLNEFGRYTVAGSVVNMLQLIVMPTFNVTFPRFTTLVATGDVVQLTASYRTGTRLLGSLLFPAVMVLGLFSQDLVRIWTGKPDLAEAIAPLVGVLGAGSAIHGVLNLPYALQLAYGQTRLTLQTNAILTVIVVPLIVVLILSYGAMGAAVAWLLLHSLATLITPWITHRSLLVGIGRTWLVRDVGIPLSVAAAVGGLGALLLRAAQPDLAARLVLAVTLGFLASAATLALSPAARAVAWSSIKRALPGALSAG